MAAKTINFAALTGFSGNAAVVFSTILLLLTTTRVFSRETNAAFANVYSEYEDFKLASLIKRIGDVGRLEAVVDLRGFIPVWGKARPHTQDSDLKNLHEVPGLFKVPTKLAVAVIYYGQGDTVLTDNNMDAHLIWSYQINHTPMAKMDSVKVFQEKDLSGEYTEWANVAYDISSAGEPLYKALDGGSGFQAAEPVAVLFTEDSVLIMVHFRYTSTSLFEKDLTFNGQYLVGLEFSRHLKRYKAVYDIYDTFSLRPSLKKSLEESAPIVLKILNSLNSVK